MAARILIIDDEKAIRELVKDALSIAGFDVTGASDGIEALNAIKDQKWDLYILDINLPKLDGFTILERIRESDELTPVILLSARADTEDVNHGLKIGADDYVRKPFGLEELTLRVKAQLRRSSPTSLSEIVSVGPIRIDTSKHEVTLFDELIELSKTEFRLLLELASKPDHLFSKERLLENVWGIDFEINTTVVDTYISYLRKKLHKNGFEGIQTVRGIGFKLVKK
jgi:two-component system OmpR family response regulator